MKDRVSLTRIIRVVQNRVLLNIVAAIGVKRGGLATLCRLKIEASLYLMRTPCLRQVVGEISCDRCFICRIECD